MTVGNLKGKKTFAPNQDKNKLFINEKLGDVRTLQELPKYSYDTFVQRSSTIDVIWFNERQMPDSFFEVEHSTDIQNSLIKFNDLIDFSARMIIVADSNRHSEYEKKIKYSSFDNLITNKRVTFLREPLKTSVFRGNSENATLQVLLSSGLATRQATSFLGF